MSSKFYTFFRNIAVGLAFAATLVLGACGTSSQTPVDKLDQAEESLASGDVAKAQQLADQLADDQTIGQLSTAELCRLSVLFMHLGEDNEANTALAARAIGAAFAADRDSTQTFIDALPIADQAEIMIVATLGAPLKVKDYTEEPDSI